jgi:hypothetical protein
MPYFFVAYHIQYIDIAAACCSQPIFHSKISDDDTERLFFLS